MLFGNVKKLELVPYTYKKIRNCIREAVDVALDNPDGKYPLSDPEIFVILASAETEPADLRPAEIHKKYIDVQILLEGEERIGYSNHLDKKYGEAEMPANDLLYIEQVSEENFVDLRPGDFALFTPEQIHRPLCAIASPTTVRKAVIKIPYGLFSEY